MFGFRLANEARQTANVANSTASEALNAIRSHADFCTERERRRDEEHRDNLKRMDNMSERLSGLSKWIVGMVVVFLANAAILLLGSSAFLFVHFVIENGH